jgi:hypothetical protein
MMLHRAGQSGKVIPAFQDRNDRRHILYFLCHCCVGDIGELHLCQGVVSVRIKAGGEHQQIGRKFLQCGDNFLVICAEVSIFTCAGGKGNIQREPFPRSGSLLIPSSRTWIERILMQANVEDRRIPLKDVLCAIAMVDIPVQNGNLPQTVSSLRIARSDRDVVEKTEPHWTISFRVMAGGAYDAEGVYHTALRHRINPAEYATGGKQSDVK